MLDLLLKMLLSSQQNITFGFLPNIQQVALWPPRDQIKKLLFPESQLKLVLDHASLKNSQIKQSLDHKVLILTLWHLCLLDPVHFIANSYISFDPHLSIQLEVRALCDLVLQ